MKNKFSVHCVLKKSIAKSFSTVNDFISVNWEFFLDNSFAVCTAGKQFYISAQNTRKQYMVSCVQVSRLNQVQRVKF